MALVLQPGPLTEASFTADSHAAKYLSTLQRHPGAFARLLDVLNRPETARRLTAVPEGEPALGAIVEQLERDELLAKAIGSAPDSLRFRQGVGVAVRLRMEQLGWTPAGSKGTVRRSRHFGRAERYQPPEALGSQDRALAVLDSLLEMGTDAERSDTGPALQQALRETRRAAGRAF